MKPTMQLWWDLAGDAVDDLVDSVELLVEDQDEDADEQLEESAAYLFDEVPVAMLLMVLAHREEL